MGQGLGLHRAGAGAVVMPKMTVTTNDGRFVADIEIGDVDPVDYQPEIDDVLREAFELEGSPVPAWLQRDDVSPKFPPSHP
jgi:hypothetical protein